MILKEDLRAEDMPRHIAVIMDGNGRWAKSKGFLRAIGHENGVEPLRNITKTCSDLGVRYLTAYAFSQENWNRPRREVNALMALLVTSLKKELKTLHDHKVRLSSIGRVENLPKKCQRELEEVKEQTAHYDKLTLTLALSYGSRDEIVGASRQLAQQVKEGKINPEDIDENLFERNLFTADMPNPDLLIRTSGEYRISNYLLWQIAYSELYFSEKLWPDFKNEDLYQAIWDYQNRERRFGKISEQLNSGV